MWIFGLKGLKEHVGLYAVQEQFYGHVGPGIQSSSSIT